MPVVTGSVDWTQSRVVDFKSHLTNSSCTMDSTSHEEEVYSGAIVASPDAFAYLTPNGTTAQLLLSSIAGTIAGTDHRVASGTQSGTSCGSPPAPIDQTTQLTHNVVADTFSLTGDLSADGKSFSGSQSATFDGLPPRKYVVTWSFAR